MKNKEKLRNKQEKPKKSQEQPMFPYSLTEARLIGFLWGIKEEVQRNRHKAFSGFCASGPAIALAILFSLGFYHKSQNSFSFLKRTENLQREI